MRGLGLPVRTSDRRRLCMLVLGLVLSAIAWSGWVFVSSASAASPWWHLVPRVQPANLSPGGEGLIVVQAENIGDAPTAGPVTISATLPTGISVQGVQFFAYSLGENDFGEFLCSAVASRVTCSTAELIEAIPAINPYENLEVRIAAKVEAAIPFEADVDATVSGGEAPSVSTRQYLSVSSAAPTFGVERYESTPEADGGGTDLQAGSHPFQFSTTFNFDQTADLAHPPALARRVEVKTPPGLIGNATPIPQCSDLQFRHVTVGGVANLCPSNAAIGVASVVVDEPAHLGLRTYPIPVFNLTPGRGEPARFGFEFVGIPVTLDTAVRTGEDYGVTVTSNNITELANVVSATVTLWGVPGDPSHDESRGWGCIANRTFGNEAGLPCEPAPAGQEKPFLTLPTSCAEPFTSRIETAAWPTSADPAGAKSAPVANTLEDPFGNPISLTGCNRLSFDPSIEVKPDGQAASTPTGFTTRLHVPQEVSEASAGLASANVKDISIALPEGVTVNPAGANGLEACAEAQVGYLPEASGPPADLHFTPTLGSPFCPDAAKVGTVKIATPVLANPLEGAVYLAAQNANPFGSLIAMYLVAEDPISGVLIKLAGEVTLSDTGSIVGTFRNSPQAPFEDAVLHFFDGPQAPLATPARCGAYTTSGSFTPWSGGATVQSQSHFEIISGPSGRPCPNPLPFAPSLAAGTSNPQAGAFSSLTTTISREDGNQDLQTVQLRTPPGVSGVLTGVKLCADAQANAGTCGPESEIGRTTVDAGLGSEPFEVTGGQVFLTEGYKGAPFGLSIVNPAKAGPFDLGKVIVRAKVEVDPLTAALTVTSDPFPHIRDGIPLEIKHVNVTIDRPGFTFNPTNCAASTISVTIGSVEGASAGVSVPFRAANCAALKFAPKFTAATAGHTSKAKGASLSVKITYPSAGFGTYANVAKVKVSLPKQLPSRLTTLQKACTAAVFDVNPANCPAASIVGHAKVITPVLPVALTGPAYFVSHGGEAFPDLTMVLQGYGVTVDLVGSTQIKKGITTSTFKETPDVPFSSFELDLPQGQFSALAANANLCSSKLAMPTEFTAQNGAVLTQSTPIKVTGCAKPLTNKRKLAKALRECHKKNKAKRRGCEERARKRFPTKRK
jgi:hypothetical protein